MTLELTPHALCDWYAQEQVVAFTLTDNHPAHIDGLVDYVLEMLRTWNPEKPLLIMYDLSQISMTPYGQQRAIEVYDAVPLTLVGRTALLLPYSSFGTRMISFASFFMPVQNRNMKRRFFRQREEALRWLVDGTRTLSMDPALFGRIKSALNLEKS